MFVKAPGNTFPCWVFFGAIVWRHIESMALTVCIGAKVYISVVLAAAAVQCQRRSRIVTFI